MPDDEVKQDGATGVREYADIEVHGVSRARMADLSASAIVTAAPLGRDWSSDARPSDTESHGEGRARIEPSMRDWSSATRHGDIEVIEDRAAGIWVGRHRVYAIVSQGETELEAVEATLEAFELGRTHYAALRLALPTWKG